MKMATSDAPTSAAPSSPPPSSDGARTSPVILVVAWLAVGLPLLWGVAQTFKKALALFG
jgi:hypothetical protein